MTRAQFDQLCLNTLAATPCYHHEDLSHAARCCLTRYHQVHGSTWDELGLLFLTSPNTARSTYNDIMMYILMSDPFLCAPTMMNRPLTAEQVIPLNSWHK